MAYDEELAGRIRALVSDESGVVEQKMFGGIAFLIGGNLAVAASDQGGILLRADPEESDALCAAGSAEPAEMRGRIMRGWLRVAPDDLAEADELERWVGVATSYARSLPPK